MPIEDIDFLKANSITQQYIFLVNSSDRDRSANPLPSEYVVNFTVPFNNVVGLKVVDSSMPRTMYNVDVYNNTLIYYISSNGILPTNLEDISFKTATIEPGDYTPQTLIIAVNTAILNSVDNPNIFITMESITNPPEIKNTFRFHCPYPFILDMSLSTIAETLGFDLYTSISELSKPLLSQKYTPIVYGNNQKLYGSVNVNIANTYINNIYTGPQSVIRQTSILYPNKLAQYFKINSKCYLYQINAAFASITGLLTNSSIVYWEIQGHDSINNIPNSTIIPLNDSNNNIVNGTINVTYLDGGYSDSNTVQTLLDIGEYWVVFYTNDATIQMYYNDILPSIQNYAMKVYDGTSWTSYDTVNEIHYESSIIISVKEQYHVITAPGIYNLLGEPYIVLRCPEIEQNSFRYLAYTKHFLGLAKFKLGSVGYNNAEIYNVDIRQFHPIGKLAKLSLRFENSKGMLYDFKGVNHNITFAIEYLEPIQKKLFNNSILNPNYDGNYIGYMFHQEDNEEDSEDQEYTYDEDNIANYKINEARYTSEEIERIDNEAMQRFRLDREDDS